MTITSVSISQPTVGKLSESTAAILRLPPEIHVHISRFLDAKSEIAFTSTCRTLHTLRPLILKTENLSMMLETLLDKRDIPQLTAFSKAYKSSLWRHCNVQISVVEDRLATVVSCVISKVSALARCLFAVFLPCILTKI